MLHLHSYLKHSCNPAWVTGSCQKHKEVGSEAKEMYILP